MEIRVSRRYRLRNSYFIISIRAKLGVERKQVLLWRHDDGGWAAGELTLALIPSSVFSPGEQDKEG